MRVFIPNDVSSAIEVGIHRLVKQNSDMQSKLDQITALLAPKTDEELKSLAIPFVIVAVVSGASKKHDQEECVDCGHIGSFVFLKCDCGMPCMKFCHHYIPICRVCLSGNKDAYDLLNEIRRILAEDTNGQ